MANYNREIPCTAAQERDLQAFVVISLKPTENEVYCIEIPLASRL